MLFTKANKNFKKRERKPKRALFSSCDCLVLSLSLPPSLLLLLLWSSESVDIGHTSCTLQLLLTLSSAMVCFLHYLLIFHSSSIIRETTSIKVSSITVSYCIPTLIQVPSRFMRINDGQFAIYFCCRLLHGHYQRGSLVEGTLPYSIS